MPYPIHTLAVDQILTFRQAHLWPDKPIDHVKMLGDDAALHLGAFDGENLIGVASFFQESSGMRLRKLAVAPDYRGAGLGSKLVQEGAAMAKEQGFAELWCDARQSACGFYQALGFVLEEHTFTKSGLTYQIARLNLKNQPE